MDTLEDNFIQVNGIQMHYVSAGQGVPLILLHGFPEYWYTWRHQIPFLAKQFRVIAPDLRGYNETEKPSEVSAYDIEILTKDIVAFIHTLGHSKAHIVGHDWGGGIAWQLAQQHPEVVDRLVILNSPHPRAFARALKSNFQQMAKSWYFFFFQLPYLPEMLFKMRAKQILERVLRGSTLRKETFSEEDIEKYQQALNKPGAFTAALNYYRAAFRKILQKATREHQKIATPTLLIWGEKDSALGKELTYGMDDLFTGPFQIHYIPDCGHFVNEEQPEIVNTLILKHLSISNPQ